MFAMMVALFLWWFFTGCIMLAVRFADRRGGNAHFMLWVTAAPFIGVGFYCVAYSLDTTTVLSSYIGFIGALLVWGWLELGFLTGVVTGEHDHHAQAPRSVARQSNLMGAVKALMYHEISLLLGLLLLLAMSHEARNHIAVYTYAILFVARIGAKLNLFFGVPRINKQFIPARLLHLKGFLHEGPISIAFPIVITALTGLLVLLLFALWRAEEQGVIVAHALLASLAGLALLEHWLMVVPLPDAKLWQWMLPESVQEYEEKGKYHEL
ncbi:MAG: DUF3623 family protein [Alphaproteobacteria bacterium]|nr:DUF3623 family protein [Alphaproteobacteria bacterium]